MKVTLHGPLPPGVTDHGALTGPEPTVEDLQAQQLQLQNRILERQRAQQEKDKAAAEARRAQQGKQAEALFDDVADEMCRQWAHLRQLHLEMCELLQALADGSASLSQLYNSIVVARGLPAPDLLTQVRRLGTCPNVLRDLLAEDWATPTGTGYDWQIQCVPLKKIRGRTK